MAEFRLVEAKERHVGQIIHRLRRAQTAAMVSIGVRSHAELRNRFHESAWKRAWTIDGSLAALGGVTGSPISPSGLVWLAMSDECAKYPRQTALTARAQLEQIMKTRHEVMTLMFPGDAVSMRWVRFLGFEAVGEPNPDGTLLMRHRKCSTLPPPFPSPITPSSDGSSESMGSTST